MQIGIASQIYLFVILETSLHVNNKLLLRKYSLFTLFSSLQSGDTIDNVLQFRSKLKGKSTNFLNKINVTIIFEHINIIKYFLYEKCLEDIHFKTSVVLVNET